MPTHPGSWRRAPNRVAGQGGCGPLRVRRESSFRSSLFLKRNFLAGGRGEVRRSSSESGVCPLLSDLRTMETCLRIRDIGHTGGVVGRVLPVLLIVSATGRCRSGPFGPVPAVRRVALRPLIDGPVRPPSSKRWADWRQAYVVRGGGSGSGSSCGSDGAGGREPDDRGGGPGIGDATEGPEAGVTGLTGARVGRMICCGAGVGRSEPDRTGRGEETPEGSSSSAGGGGTGALTAGAAWGCAGGGDGSGGAGGVAGGWAAGGSGGGGDGGGATTSAGRAGGAGGVAGGWAAGGSGGGVVGGGATTAAGGASGGGAEAGGAKARGGRGDGASGLGRGGNEPPAGRGSPGGGGGGVAGGREGLLVLPGAGAAPPVVAISLGSPCFAPRPGINDVKRLSHGFLIRGVSASSFALVPGFGPLAPVVETRRAAQDAQT